MYQELFMMVVQTLAGSTSQRYPNHFPNLQQTPWSSLPSTCVRAVWPKSAHSSTSPFSWFGVYFYSIGMSFLSDFNYAFFF